MLNNCVFILQKLKLLYNGLIELKTLMTVRKLVYIFIDEGEFLYDQVTNKVYSYTAPHTLVGKIDSKEFTIIPKHVPDKV